MPKGTHCRSTIGMCSCFYPTGCLVCGYCITYHRLAWTPGGGEATKSLSHAPNIDVSHSQCCAATGQRTSPSQSSQEELKMWPRGAGDLRDKLHPSSIAFFGTESVIN